LGFFFKAPLMTVARSLTEQIHIYDQKIAQIARSEYAMERRAVEGAPGGCLILQASERNGW
jgi:hypothetical protein